MNRLNNFFLSLLLLMVSVTVAYSQPSAEWDNGNDLYARGSYQEALNSYLQIEEQGYASAQLYYNIGNSYFKTGSYGKAILYYERAQKLNPSGRDIAYNLEFARQYVVDDIQEVPEFILKTWARNVNYSFDSDFWTVASLLLFALTAALLLNFRYGRSPAVRKASFFTALIFLFFATIFTLFAWSQKSAFNSEKEAIVMVPVSTVRNSPDNSGSTLFILHEGAKVELIEQIGGWRHIELGDGRQGWIAAADLEVI